MLTCLHCDIYWGRNIGIEAANHFLQFFVCFWGGEIEEEKKHKKKQLLVQRENLEAHFEHLQVWYGCDQSSETSFIFVKIQGDSLKHFEQVLKFWIELELWNEPQGFSGFYFKLWISSSGYQSPEGSLEKWLILTKPWSCTLATVDSELGCKAAMIKSCKAQELLPTDFDNAIKGCQRNPI